MRDIDPDAAYDRFRRTAEAFAALGIAIDHMLSSELTSEGLADLVAWRTLDDDAISDPQFVLLQAVLDRTVHGSTLRGFTEAAAAAAARRHTARAALVCARSALEVCAEMQWLYQPTIDWDERLNRTLTSYLRQEWGRAQLAKDFALADPPVSLTEAACSSRGIEIGRDDRNGPYVGKKKPGPTRLVADLVSAVDRTHTAVYRQLSFIAHGGAYLAQSDGLRGDHPNEWTEDTFGHVHLGVPTGLLEIVGRALLQASDSAALYFGQDRSHVVSTYVALRSAAGLSS